MARIEDEIAGAVAGELDAGEAPPAHHGTFEPGGGPGTSSMNYAPGTSQTEGHRVTPLNGGSGTSIGVEFTDPGGDLAAATIAEAADAEAREERARMLAEVIAQTRLDRAAADASFRAFCRAGRTESEHIPGLDELKAKIEGTEK